MTLGCHVVELKLKQRMQWGIICGPRDQFNNIRVSLVFILKFTNKRAQLRNRQQFTIFCVCIRTFGPFSSVYVVFGGSELLYIFKHQGGISRTVHLFLNIGCNLNECPLTIPHFSRDNV